MALTQTFFSLLLLLPICSVSQTTGNITVGGSSLKLTTLHVSLLLRPERTIVWYANGDKLAPWGSKVELNADRGLVLTSPRGEELWTSEILTGGLAYGLMEDTGNFVLQDSNFNKVWESFQYPTDTILPTQIIERGGVLSSQQSETNFSKGRFQLRFVEAGNKQSIKVGSLVLHVINLPTTEPTRPYYVKDSTAGDTNASSPGRQLLFSESGYIYFLKENGERLNLSQGGHSTGNFFFRVTLNFDGIFTVYSHPKSSTVNGSWTAV
ncbi:G-type lectin S-receptor-like serine/threonine-protein kinase RLK1 [Morella rubra]|uniref:G-type lectin S-receptor-like serine/threonine-protein kinase RLK1 n=1 Tax=Morella rubra TaxID=262757 RepID=A0A6A1WWG9_9ROSI|nr:G-type lectin S-receptor-like serine/threonine-protein kinase RLK1 [Morella rubra]